MELAQSCNPYLPWDEPTPSYLLSIHSRDREGDEGAVEERVGHGQACDESCLVLGDCEDGLGLVQVLVLVEVVAEVVELQSL